MENYYLRFSCKEERISSEFIFRTTKGYESAISILRKHGVEKSKARNGEYFVKTLDEDVLVIKAITQSCLDA